MFSTTGLRPLLAERGCSMEELIEPVAAVGSGRKRAASGGTGETDESGVSAFRPKRARIVPE